VPEAVVQDGGVISPGLVLLPRETASGDGSKAHQLEQPVADAHRADFPRLAPAEHGDDT
jgi:hypothetical protein